jgi:Spy/CpxP family protein refolding chaperone
VSAVEIGPASRSGAPTRWPSRRVLVILLVVSVVLNLCFLAGAAWTRWQQPTRWDSEQRFQQMAAELNLAPEQRPGFDTYVAAMRAHSEKMHEQVAPLMTAVWAEIAKPQADAAQVMRLLDEAAEKRREFQRETTVKTLEFLAVLSPEQRAKFVAIGREQRLRSRAARQ